MKDDTPTDALITLLMLVFGVIYTGLTIWMFVAPESFYDTIGPYGAFNSHYTRDSAAFQGGIGIAALAAVRWSVLRPGAALALCGATALHLISHLIDINGATGHTAIDIVEAIILIPTTLLTAWLVWASIDPNQA